MVQELQLTYRVVSTPGLQSEISELETQMGTLKQGTPQYQYDELQLAYEERELEIRKEHPNINPTTQEGAKELAAILNQDPTLQKINAVTKALVDAHPYAYTTWGIPME